MAAPRKKTATPAAAPPPGSPAAKFVWQPGDVTVTHRPEPKKSATPPGKKPAQ